MIGTLNMWTKTNLSFFYADILNYSLTVTEGWLIQSGFLFANIPVYSTRHNAFINALTGYLGSCHAPAVVNQAVHTYLRAVLFSLVFSAYPGEELLHSMVLSGFEHFEEPKEPDWDGGSSRLRKRRRWLKGKIQSTDESAQGLWYMTEQIQLVIQDTTVFLLYV